MDANGVWYGLTDQKQSDPPRVLVIGAGSRGNAYSTAISTSTTGIVHAIAEPIDFKRREFGRKFIWGQRGRASVGQEFVDWRDFVVYEQGRRTSAEAGNSVEDGVDAVLICTLDEQHAEIIAALAPLNLHILSEKPLATTLKDCLDVYFSMRRETGEMEQKAIFGIGHVLRYSPHNVLLRRLLLEEKIIGEILSVEHTEPVGYWHFAHSYVRGNWRKESKTAPSLLTKSCHDIDFLLWLLCSSVDDKVAPHLPSKITSSGRLNYFRKARKPSAAGAATNCFKCSIQNSCVYSSSKIYLGALADRGCGWPVKIVVPEIEDCYLRHGRKAAETKLIESLQEDYDRKAMSQANIDARPWFGRCVYESDNDVCDDQTVTIVWDDDPVTSNGRTTLRNRFAKSATFHMIAQTESICKRRGRVYGTKGEISYDSDSIRVFDFATNQGKQYFPDHSSGGGHGGGDDGLAQAFIQAVEAVKNGKSSVRDAQKRFIGCTLDDIIRSHAVVFAAEEARREGRTVDWKEWWEWELEARSSWPESEDPGSTVVV